MQDEVLSYLRELDEEHADCPRADHAVTTPLLVERVVARLAERDGDEEGPHPESVRRAVRSLRSAGRVTTQRLNVVRIADEEDDR